MSQANRRSFVLPVLILSTVAAYLAFGLIANAALSGAAPAGLNMGLTIGH